MRYLLFLHTCLLRYYTDLRCYGLPAFTGSLFWLFLLPLDQDPTSSGAPPLHCLFAAHLPLPAMTLHGISFLFTPPWFAYTPLVPVLPAASYQLLYHQSICYLTFISLVTRTPYYSLPSTTTPPTLLPDWFAWFPMRRAAFACLRLLCGSYAMPYHCCVPA